MRRKQATALIDELRILAAAPMSGDELSLRLQGALESYGLRALTPCPGEARSNPHIDNCSLCAPRWGWVGPVEVIS